MEKVERITARTILVSEYYSSAIKDGIIAYYQFATASWRSEFVQSFQSWNKVFGM